MSQKWCDLRHGSHLGHRSRVTFANCDLNHVSVRTSWDHYLRRTEDLHSLADSAFSCSSCSLVSCVSPPSSSLASSLLESSSSFTVSAGVFFGDRSTSAELAANVESVDGGAGGKMGSCFLAAAGGSSEIGPRLYLMIQNCISKL